MLPMTVDLLLSLGYLGLTGTPFTCISLLGGTMILKNFTYESDRIGKMIYNNSVSSKFFGLSVSD